MPNKNTKTREQMLAQMMDIFDSKRLSDEDVVKVIETLVKYAQETRNMTERELLSMRQALDAVQESIKVQNTEQVDSLKEKVMRYCMAEMEKMMQSHKEKMLQMDAKMDSVKDGETPDTEEIVLQVMDRIEVPTVEDILKSIPEGEKLTIEAVEGLREELDAIKRQKSSGTSGSIMPVSHWPLHESFTMNGTDTEITLSQGVGAAGTAIFGLRYQGQVQVLGTDYTVSGNKITFVSFTPEADTIVSVSYMP